MKYITTEIMGRPFRGYIPDGTERAYYKGKRPAVIIFPGGGYYFTYEGEGEPIALRFASQGICAFVLEYTCTDTADSAYPHAQKQAFASIAYVRDHAEEWGIDPRNIATCGFSAGGHLCACTGVLWNKEEAFFEGDPAYHRPDKLILCYPVMRGGKEGNHGSLQNLYGNTEVPKEFLDRFDLPPKVDGETPPAFLWATAADGAVPATCSLDFASALAMHGVPYELHIWRDGDHGLCLGDHVTQAMPFGNPLPVAEWISLATRFLYT